MMIEICAVGGYGEVGKNMTAVKVGNEVVLFDMGLHLPNFIKLNDTLEESQRVSETNLKNANAIPNDNIMKDWRDNVIAIVIGHAHLDHIGATPYLAQKYNAPIYCTPFTAEVLKSILRNDRIEMGNEIIKLKETGKFKLSQDLTLEFVRTTHSTPQTVFCILHTKEGAVVYGNDYKLDDSPTLGKPPDYARIKKLAKEGVFALIQDCLYGYADDFCPSESVAEELLFDAVKKCDKSKGIIVTTFSSHIARLRSISKAAKRVKRKVIFMGRSLAKYIWSARDAKLIDLEKQGRVLKYSRQIRAMLKKVLKNKKDYLIVVSGHQGEPQSTLAKMIDGRYAWSFDEGDAVIFSSSVIPDEINIDNRRVMDESLKEMGVNLFTDIHVSGHAFLKDLENVVKLFKPEHILPTHGEARSTTPFVKMVKKLGYSDDKIHVLQTGDRISIE